MVFETHIEVGVFDNWKETRDLPRMQYYAKVCNTEVVVAGNTPEEAFQNLLKSDAPVVQQQISGWDLSEKKGE